MPPTPWHGNTSSVSSIDVRDLHITTRLLTTAATIPMMKALDTVTKPAAGVMATRPTTAPIQAPITDGFLPNAISKNTHDIAAAADAVVVVANAVAASAPEPNAEPALNPNHPNHNKPVP